MAESKYKAVLDKDLLIKHYSQPHVLKAMLDISENKEVVGSYGGTGYARRPDAIRFENDITEQVKKGVTSFHISEETWQNPFLLIPGSTPKEQDQLRTAWDLILDIDCIFLEYSQLAAHLIIQALESLGIEAITCKFSGNHGFHIGIPFEAFPETINGQPTKELFPEAARIIAEYLKDKIEQKNGKGHLTQAILDYEKQQHSLTHDTDILPIIMKKTDLTFEQLTKQYQKENQTVTEFNAYNILEIDTILISSRHLVRHVYSVNEKSGLVSIPINPKTVLKFNKDIAKIENFIESKYKFLERACSKKGVDKLFLQAYDFEKSKQPLQLTLTEKKKNFQTLDQAVPETYFPPAIQQINQGLKDGKKRALFILINFLGSIGWAPAHIEEYIYEWNKKNPEPLKEVYLKGQLKGLKTHKPILPPNYDHKGYYEQLGINPAQELKEGFKNPVTYAISKFQRDNKPQQGRQKLTEEQKEARREWRKKQKELQQQE